MSLLQTPLKESPLSAPLLVTLIMTTSSCSHNASLSFVSFLCRNYTLHRPGAPLPFPSLPIQPCPPPSASETVSDTISHRKSCLCPKEVVRASHRCLVPTPVLTIPSKTFFSCFFYVLVSLSLHPIVIMTTLSILLHFETVFSYLNISKIRLFWK